MKRNQSNKTGISWCHATWNPWRGCRRKSPGCKKCYMFRDQPKYGFDPTVVTKCSQSTFNKPFRIKDPSLIFTCSWSDFFIEESDAWRDEAWSIIEDTPHHLYLILTKRPERLAEQLPKKLPKNIILGVSCENRAMSIERIELLRRVQNVRRFISFEPLLEDIGNQDLSGFEWAIIGGESGDEDSRPMHPDWARNIVRLCREQGLRIHFKQWSQVDIHGRYRPYIKSLGRELDGVIWNEFPDFHIEGDVE